MKVTSPIYHKIAEDILDFIGRDNFSVGSRLPSERELAEKFGVSRTCIREAKIVLEVQGRLKVKACSGAYVYTKNKIEADNLSNLKYFELIEAHGLFEAEVAALAAPLISDEIIEKLEWLAPIIVGKVKTEMAPDEAVTRFFNLIARATNNRAIIFMIESMWDMKPNDNQAPRIHQRIYNQLSSCLEDKYQAIINALKKRDPELARKAVQEQFTYIMEGVLKTSEFDAYQEMERKMSETRSRFLLSSQLG